eukprot:scaffold14203_cov170-Amphora_coffeaeformis.AAC.3
MDPFKLSSTSESARREQVKRRYRHDIVVFKVRVDGSLRFATIPNDFTSLKQSVTFLDARGLSSPIGDEVREFAEYHVKPAGVNNKVWVFRQLKRLPNFLQEFAVETEVLMFDVRLFRELSARQTGPRDEYTSYCECCNVRQSFDLKKVQQVRHCSEPFRPALTTTTGE